MDKDTRNEIERATQRARRLLEEDYAAQLEGEFDVQRSGGVAAQAGRHLDPRRAAQRERIVASIEHKLAAGMSAAEAVADYLRDAAFTTLNRFAALKMLEARELVQECISKGEDSAGYREFCGLAPGLPLLPESSGYRLYIESLFDELSTEIKVLFDRRDPASVLWPRRATFEALLALLNSAELATVWGEDETIGWVYQYFNGADERRKMREESQAPRNSRELAVRNQFFTPRYVVQFLIDNTLGRIWYEMRGTKTVLAEKCEYMVRGRGEEGAPRAKKDPRDLRILDPACGSGHFLLYAFDLLLAIYEEAYTDADSPKSEATGKGLAEDYPNLDALRRAVPALVLAHNLHGVDIDPRCVQIAQLSLWLQAQKCYRDFGIGRIERARIRRSNIIVAEPLVADEQIAMEFVSTLDDVALGRVFMSLVESLNLAGELGLLLRVEQLVAGQTQRGQTGDLFAPPQESIGAALDRFVLQQVGTTSTRRRLFADDAAQGVGLFGIAAKRFDAVVMNPPFGAATPRTKAVLEASYPRSRTDLYAVFVDRGVELLSPLGLLGAITSRTGFFLASYQSWREDLLLAEAQPTTLADLGQGVMDSAMVEAAAYCLRRGGDVSETVFFRLLDCFEKGSALRDRIRAEDDVSVYRVAVEEFAAVPRSPFAYWVSSGIRSLFGRLQPFEAEGRAARHGASTLDNFRFLRLSWEVSPKANRRWVPYAKGGEFSPFYDDVHLMLNWTDDGAEVKAFVEAKVGSASRTIQATEFYFRPGLTWPSRTQSGFAPRALPSGCIFDCKGNTAFLPGDDAEDLLAQLALFLSAVVRILVGVQMSFGSYDVGVIQRVPLPVLTREAKLQLAQLARQGWALMQAHDTGNETSHAFVVPRLDDARRESNRSDGDTVALDEIRRSINDLAFAIYGITATDRAAIVRWSGDQFESEESSSEGEAESEALSRDAPDSSALAPLSWLIGLAFGRFDPRIASGERATPSPPEPFDPLPSRAPGMYPEDEDPTDRPDVLVDDQGHVDDLTTRALAAGERVRIGAPENLRGWLAKEFFARHIKMYSKSRRKAPIYWQLAAPSASYSVWLYIHAFTKDTLFRVQNDYAAPKLAHEERRLEVLASELRDGGTAAQRRALAAQETFVEELRAFLDEVKRIAPLWNPDLDDGVIINFAPLWRLVPQHKAWQKEVKATWDALCDGKYDWSHLAMHLWPERVVPKCATDRSFAIAHGLEDVFWVEGSDGKWTARKTPTRPMEELVRERTSAAVKDALKSLLEAPPLAGSNGGRRGRQRRRATAVLGEEV